MENIQSDFTYHNIMLQWEKFRECENKKDGKIPREEFISAFKAVFRFATNDEICDQLFRRFHYESNYAVDIYDFLISVAVLTRLSSEKKLDLILEVMDVDEDGCLSIEEVFKMIFTIEKNFVKEINYLNFKSESIYVELALKNSGMKFRTIMNHHVKLEKNKQKKALEAQETGKDQ